MRILVTNDDGVRSDGLWRLAKALSAVGDVSVVAPDRDQSGVGTALTLTSVLRVESVQSPLDGVAAVAVQGTPADCVVLAIESILDEPIDLVVSGINRGSNVGHDVLISGTVGAAAHGYVRGITSVAVSVKYRNDVRYDVASRTAAALARALIETPSEVPQLINVNVPDAGVEEISRVALTRPGPRAYLENVAEGRDGSRTHYWITHDRDVDAEPPRDTDVWAMREGAISISRLDFGFSDGTQATSLDPVAEAVRAELGLHRSA